MQLLYLVSSLSDFFVISQITSFIPTKKKKKKKKFQVRADDSADKLIQKTDKLTCTC